MPLIAIFAKSGSMIRKRQTEGRITAFPEGIEQPAQFTIHIAECGALAVYGVLLAPGIK